VRPQAISVGDALPACLDERRKPGEMLVIVAKLQAPFTSAHIITTSSWRHQNKNPATASESRDHIAGDIPRVGARRNRETCSSSPRHASSSRRLRPGRSSHRGGAGVQPSGPHRSSRRRRLSRSRLPRPGSTCSQSTARVYLGPALVESSSNPHRHGAVQEHARRSRSRAGNEDRWPVAGSEIHAACRGPAAQPATTALPRSHRGTARWGWRCTSEPGRRTNVDVEADAEDTITKTPREEATSSRCRRREDAEA